MTAPFGYARSMPLRRALAVPAVLVISLLAAPAAADAPNFKGTIEMGGGVMWPVAGGAFRDNYSVGGLGIIRGRWFIDKVFSVGLSAVLGGVATDNDALRSRYAARLTETTPDVTGGSMLFAGGVVTGNAYVLGNQKSGGMYVTLSAGLGGAWARRVVFGKDFKDSGFQTISTEPTEPPPDPFAESAICGIFMAGIGGSTGNPMSSPYVSFGIEAGPTLLIVGGRPALMIGISGTFGFFVW
ncbi:Hypothetical protein A7982_00739 [Minicystis rosea]|nr:Hypothetical protein A7982_00739 [Minicystis rosea]